MMILYICCVLIFINFLLIYIATSFLIVLSSNLERERRGEREGGKEKERERKKNSI